jgi:hypothetical protein
MENRRTWAILLAAAISGMNGHAQASAHQGLTFNGDGALRNNRIHWPKGFEPEQADLFAHNEIDIQAGCEIAFSHLVDAEAWFGDGKDVHAYHTFLLTKAPEGCHIVTEENVEGPGAIQCREQQPNAMHEGHQLWPAALKDRSEKH